MSDPLHASFQFSRYLRWKQKGDWIAVFHELHPHCVYVPLNTWNLAMENLSSIPENIFTELCERKLLITSEQEDEEELTFAEGDLKERLDRASILYLVLVQVCNFNCSYCPIPLIAKQTGEVHMTPEIARMAIDLWVKHIWDDYSPTADYFVIFYGGEPLMNKAVIKVGLEYIATLQLEGKLPVQNLNLMVSTNGVLIDDELIRLFKEYKVMVAVGCDGPEEYHDKIRRDVEGQATFSKVEQAIKALVGNGIRTFASVSITPYNIKAIDQFSSFFEQYGIEKFGFNFLRGKLLLSLIPQAELAEYYENATDGVIRNFNNYGKRHLEYQVERKYAAFHNKRFFPTDCNGYGNQLVIQPNGKIGNCPFLKNDMGSVETVAENFRISHIPLGHEWRKRLPLYNSACHTCEAKSICGGGCAWNAQELKGDFLAVDDGMCLLARKIFDDLIWSGFPLGS